MWSPLVIELTPLLDEYLGLGAAAKPFSIQQFVAQLAIEAFDEAVLSRAAGRDEGWPDRRVAQPAHDPGSGKFRTVVGPNERRLPYSRSLAQESVATEGIDNKRAAVRIGTELRRRLGTYREIDQVRAARRLGVAI